VKILECDRNNRSLSGSMVRLKLSEMISGNRIPLGNSMTRGSSVCGNHRYL
jgi:hypothetical protein